MADPDRDAPEVPAVHVLTRDQCLRLIDLGGVGRLAIRTDGPPEIRPVNFLRQGDALIVRTGNGSIFSAAERAETAAFEIDGIDPLEHTGWSVVVTGKLRALATHPELLDLPLRPWASGTKDQFVTLTLERVSGLQIPPGRGKR